MHQSNKKNFSVVATKVKRIHFPKLMFFRRWDPSKRLFFCRCTICMKKLRSPKNIHWYHKKSHLKLKLFRCKRCPSESPFVRFVHVDVDAALYLDGTKLINPKLVKKLKLKFHQCFLDASQIKIDCDDKVSDDINNNNDDPLHHQPAVSEAKAPASYDDNDNEVISRKRPRLSAPFAFQCGSCKKTFLSRGGLQCHARCQGQAAKDSAMHLKSSSKLSSKSNASFSKKRAKSVSRIKQCERDQTNSVHKCQVCGKEYPKRSRLLIHIETHSSLRPYLCELCGMSFKRKGDLRIHQSTVHVEGEEKIKQDPDE